MFAGHGRDRGTFTIEEIRILSGQGSLEAVWKWHRLHRVIKELADACLWLSHHGGSVRRF